MQKIASITKFIKLWFPSWLLTFAKLLKYDFLKGWMPLDNLIAFEEKKLQIKNNINDNNYHYNNIKTIIFHNQKEIIHIFKRCCTDWRIILVLLRTY